GSLCDAHKRDAHLSSWLVSHSRTRAQDGATACLAAKAGEQSQAQGDNNTRQSASESTSPATGFPPEDGPCYCAPGRNELLRSLGDGQHAQEPPSRQEHPRCELVAVPEHPLLQGSVRRSESHGGQSCVHQPDLFWLRRPGSEGFIRPLA